MSVVLVVLSSLVVRRRLSACSLVVRIWWLATSHGSEVQPGTRGVDAPVTVLVRDYSLPMAPRQHARCHCQRASVRQSVSSVELRIRPPASPVTARPSRARAIGVECVHAPTGTAVGRTRPPSARRPPAFRARGRRKGASPARVSPMPLACLFKLVDLDRVPRIARGSRLLAPVQRACGFCSA